MNIDLIRQKFGQAIRKEMLFRGEITLTVDPEVILPLGRFLRDEDTLAFDFLVDLCGVDLFPESPRFMVVYHLFSVRHNQRLRVKLPLAGENPVVDSVVPVWETADWHERECFDLFGISFRNHPDLRRILLPDDFTGYPLRKDFPLEGMIKP